MHVHTHGNKKKHDPHRNSPEVTTANDDSTAESDTIWKLLKVSKNNSRKKKRRRKRPSWG